MRKPYRQTEPYRRRGGFYRPIVLTLLALFCTILLYVPVQALQSPGLLIQHLDPPDGYPGRNWARIVLILGFNAFFFVTIFLILCAALWQVRRLLGAAIQSPTAARPLGAQHRFVEDRGRRWFAAMLALAPGLPGLAMSGTGVVQLAMPHASTGPAIAATAGGGVLLLLSFIVWRSGRWSPDRPRVLTISAKGITASWYAPSLLPWSKIRQIHVISEPGQRRNREADWIHVIHEGEVPDEVGALILSQQELPGAWATDMLRALDRYRPATVPLHDQRRIGYEE